MTPPYRVCVNASTHMVQEAATGRFLGAFGTNFWRSWVHPLYTPSGRTVVEEFPFDHPFHNGIFVGQNPVRVGGREGNFWALPVRRSQADHIMSRIGRMDPQGLPAVQADRDGARLMLDSVWRDEDEQPLLDERRTVTFRALADATVCDMASRKIASYGPAQFPQTKFGSIGVRVEPRLLPALGGQVIGCLEGQLRRGTADDVANGRQCDAVAYESDLPGIGVFGVCLMILDDSAGDSRSDSRRGPWFIRDYGLAMFNPTRSQPIAVPATGAWTVALRVVAYEGSLTADRVDAWGRAGSV